MARTNIEGTKTDWLVIRGQLNAMFGELYTAKDKEREGSAAVTESGTDIVFSTPYENGSTYMILRNCSNGLGEVAYTISNVTVAGFRVTSAETATFVYKTIKL